MLSWKSLCLSFRSHSIYVANLRDDETRLHSSSGGAFSAIARYVLSQGGYVIGAAYNGTQVEHIAISDVSDLWKLQKSKYAPSSLAHIDMDSLLGAGQTVLFSGTPCQVKAIARRYGHRPNLILLEIACHGVPNKRDYDAYISENDIVQIDFRCKKEGWKSNCIEFTKSDGTVVCQPASKNPFYQRYISGQILRKSCMTCQSKYFTSGADFTLADAWGVNDFAPLLDDNKGTSVIIFHSNRGERVWSAIKNQFEYQRTSLLNVIRFNPNIVRPSQSPQLFIEALDPYMEYFRIIKRKVFSR